MKRIRTARCPVGCPEGLVLGSSGRVFRCGVCHGTGRVSLDHICQCGLSCCVEKDGLFYCGDEKCYLALKSSSTQQPGQHCTVQQWGMDHWD